MAFTKARTISFQWTPVAAGSSENTQMWSIPIGYYVTHCVAHVLTAADNGSLAIGTTSGGNDLASTANIGVTSTGRKAGGIANTVMATSAALGIFMTYVNGGATIKAVVRVSAEIVPTALVA